MPDEVALRTETDMASRTALENALCMGKRICECITQGLEGVAHVIEDLLHIRTDVVALIEEADRRTETLLTLLPNPAKPVTPNPAKH